MLAGGGTRLVFRGVGWAAVVALVAALLAPVAAKVAAPAARTGLGHVTLASTSGTGPSPAFSASEVWDGGNLTEHCPMCISASQASITTPPSTNPADTVDPATADLSESYTLAAIPDPGGGELNLTATYDAQSAVQAQDEEESQGQEPMPWGYGWTDNWHQEIQSAGSNLQLIEANGATDTFTLDLPDRGLR